jgi:glycosyltransferase involved in cell wall biosynthesis
MRIAYIVFDYHKPSGMERVLAKKANYLSEHGYDVSIVALKAKDIKPFFEFDSRIMFYDLALSDDSLKYKPLFIDKLTKLFEKIKPDIAISTGISLTNYLYEVKDPSKKVLEIHFAKYKRKFELATLDNYSLGRLITDFYSRKRTNIAKEYDRFVVLTEEDKLSWRGLENISVIPNPNSFIPTEIAELTEKRVICAGHYKYQKGIDLLIDIWADINKEFSDWKLVIYGKKGSKQKKIEKLVKKRGLSNSVEMHQATSNIEQEFLKSSVCVMTSRYEGFGMVLTEAMACGLPVVSYACKCGPRDIISDGEDGFLIDMFDRKTFVNKLSLLMNNYDLRVKMGKAAKSNVEARFNEELIMSKWVSLFNDLVK